MESIAGVALAAAVFGLSAGLSPGPMLALVVGETLQRGAGAGTRVALAPLISDGPILVLVAGSALLLPPGAPAAALLSLLGGAYLGWLGWQSLAFRPAGGAGPPSPGSALWRGVLANLLNPNPYLFWASVGLPSLVQVRALGPPGPLVFVAVFYLLLVGSKVTIALAVARGRGRLQGRGHAALVRLLGLVLLAYAVLFAYRGLAGLSATAG